MPEPERRSLALSMLRRVLAAASEVGEPLLVTDDEEARKLAPRWVEDPGGGQGAAVAAALARGESRAGAGRERRPSAGRGAGPARPARGDPAGRRGPRGGGRRDDERARALLAWPLRAALRVGQRGAFPRARRASPSTYPGSPRTWTPCEGRGARRRGRRSPLPQGLVDAVDAAGVTAIGNVGDDLEILGLHVSPDLDSVLYALAGRSDEERGWGRADETWNALATVSDSAARTGSGSATATSGCTCSAPRRFAAASRSQAVTARLVERAGACG